MELGRGQLDMGKRNVIIEGDGDFLNHPNFLCITVESSKGCMGKSMDGGNFENNCGREKATLEIKVAKRLTCFNV